MIDGLPADFPPLHVKGIDVPLADRALSRNAAARISSNRLPSRMTLLIGGLTVAAGTAVALVLILVVPGGDRTPVYGSPANSALRIDPGSGDVSTATAVGRLPGAVALGAG